MFGNLVSSERGTAYSDRSICSAAATGGGSKTCGALEMGTAYSDIWACSSAFIGRCPTAEATLVSCLRAAAQAILQCSASSCSMAWRCATRVSVKQRWAWEVEETLSLP